MPPYAYLRKSSVRDLATDLSPETQEREVRALAARHNDNGSKLVMLADWDVSGRGKYTAKRQGYQQLVAAVQSGMCSAVYSYSLSRLGRSVHELSGLFDLCVERNVPVRLVADSIDTSTASGVLLANVLSSVAQFEADVASERTKAAQATRRARGERVGPRYYGDSAGENAEAVLEAFREAGSYHGAARLLNERGVPTRHGRSKNGESRGWWASSVGKMVQRLDPAIKPGKARTKTSPDFLFARLLVCPTCQTVLGGSRDSTGWTRYQCSHRTARRHVRSSVAERVLLPAIQAEAARLKTPEQLETAGDEAKRGELERRRGRILDIYESGDIDRDEYRRRMGALDEEMATLDSRRVVVTIPQIDWNWPPRQINNVLRAMFDHVELDPQTFKPVRFEWTVPEWRS